VRYPQRAGAGAQTLSREAGLTGKQLWEFDFRVMDVARVGGGPRM